MYRCRFPAEKPVRKNRMKIENFILNVAFISYNTYLLKQSAIPLTTGKAANGYKVGNFPGRVRGEVSPEPAHFTGYTGTEVTGYMTTAQQIT